MKDHTWNLAKLQLPGAVRRVCVACDAIAETTVSPRVRVTFAAPFGTPMVVHSMEAVPGCTARVAEEEARRG